MQTLTLAEPSPRAEALVAKRHEPRPKPRATVAETATPALVWDRLEAAALSDAGLELLDRLQAPSAPGRRLWELR
jgi:hypothetical protein